MVKYLPRNEFILFRFVDKGHLRTLAMPGIASQGKERVVVAVGPNVEGLKVGDKVLVIGEIGVDVIPLPNDNKLFLTKQQNVALIIEEDE